MKRLLISLLGALAFAAAAQTAEPQTAPATDAPAAAQSDAEKPVSDSFCLRHTGTRIVSRTDARADARADNRRTRTCSNGTIGRAYTRDDLDRTGEVNIADALRKLDPAIH